MNLLLLLAVAVPLSCCLGFLSLLAFLGVMILGAIIHVVGIARARRPQWRRVEPANNSAGIRMESGRFKVFKHLNDWFDEFRLYHRKDGKVHKEGDDLMSATRYAVMMLRHARTATEYNRFYRKIEYRKLGII
jgi:hypothetical protein